MSTPRRAQNTATTTPADGNESRWESRGFIVLLIAVTAALIWILLPLYGTVLWAAIVALLFAPVYRWLLARMNRRRTGAALVTLLMVLLIGVLPLVFLSASIARQAVSVYQRIQSGAWNPVAYFKRIFDALPAWILSALDNIGLGDFEAIQAQASAGLTKASSWIATQALAIGQNSFEFIASVFIMLYLAFFLIRDGDRISRAIRNAIPLSPQHRDALLSKFATVLRATVKGNILVAAIQGALGGIAFAFLGIPAPVLWGVLMAFLSLLPAVGAGLVWLPVAIYLLVTGAIWQGVGLIAYGVLVIGMIDNLLRPVLVGKDTQMPDYVVMITTLGGMAVFGINGFVIGPAIGAMFIAVWEIYSVSRESGDVGSPK